MKKRQFLAAAAVGTAGLGPQAHASLARLFLRRPESFAGPTPGSPF